MDAIAAAVAANQAQIQSQIGLAVVKMAIENQQQLVALLSQAVQAGAVNPAHLGQSLDTYA